MPVSVCTVVRSHAQSSHSESKMLKNHIMCRSRVLLWGIRLHWTLFLIDSSVFDLRFFWFFNFNDQQKFECWSIDRSFIWWESFWFSWCASNHTIFSSYRTADGGGLVEKHYVFLKRLCQVLCALGNQLCALLVSTYFLESFRAIWAEHLESYICIMSETCH